MKFTGHFLCLVLCVWVLWKIYPQPNPYYDERLDFYTTRVECEKERKKALVKDLKSRHDWKKAHPNEGVSSFADPVFKCVPDTIQP